MSESAAIDYLDFEGVAPDEIWSGVTRVYIQAFTSPPYQESSEELREIGQWGRRVLVADGGRLAVATVDGQVAGFAISERLGQNQHWQRMLETASADSGPVFPPSVTAIVQELAVDSAHRGHGLARGLVSRLLAERSEDHVVLSVYGRAAPVRAMYNRWGFVELGSVPAEDSDDTLFLMHHALPWAL